jgi:uncharacterized membrane protein YfcA
MDTPMHGLWLAAIAFGAAVINGALGYGFSSITVPLALLFLVSRVLNPALVLVEVAINICVLAVNWASIVPALRRTATIIIGLLPGVVVGSLYLASVSPDYVKFVTYGTLLPLILLQAAGVRRPIRSERVIGLPFGAGVGLLYSITTISGPPLALLFNNQGYTKNDFRASLAVVRVAESSMTAITYLLLGLFKPPSLALIPFVAPAVLIGVPVGTALIRKLDPETFRRVCMSFDAWIVAFGLSRAVPQIKLAPEPKAYLVLPTVVLIDLVLLYRFFAQRSRTSLFNQMVVSPSARSWGSDVRLDATMRTR